MVGLNKFEIDTAVITTAGRGKRLMPLTLHQPKAMVPVADRPLIHYIVDQIAAGGIKRFVIVANSAHKDIIASYAEYQKQSGEWRNLKFNFVVQKKLLGFGDAVLAAGKFTRHKPFLVAACDDLLDDQPPPIRTFLKIFNRYHQPMAVLRQVSKKEISSYGGVSVTNVARDVLQIHDIIEKPSPDKAPSSFGSIADYILPPEIFRYIRLAQKRMPKGKEVAVTHALKLYLQKGGMMFGWVFRGRHFDGGSKLGLAKASIYFGSKHPELGSPFKKYLQSL